MAALILVACAGVSFAQGEEYKKGEIFVGYSANQVDTNGAFDPSSNGDGRDNFNGINVEATGNLTRYFGIQGDFSYHQKEADFTVGTTTTNVKGKLTQFMGGVKVQDNALATRFRPFAHALVGVAHASADLRTPTVSASDSDNGLALALGGGVDVRATDSIDLRLVQVDYNPNRFNGETDHNVRLSFGVNFRF
jgi:opacity protein-like surface antigen